MTGWHGCAAIIVLAGTVTAVLGQGAEDTPLFTAQQAEQGKALYAARCAACHGETLQGAAAGPLAGPAFAAAWTSGWNDSQLTVSDLDFIIRTSMPKGAAGKMGAEEYTAVLTYIRSRTDMPQDRRLSVPVRRG